jgi:hypothetical protein
LLPQRSIRSSQPAVKFLGRDFVTMLFNSTVGLNQSSRQLVNPCHTDKLSESKRV